MAIIPQENYGKLVDAKLRATLATKDGVVFNTKYNDQANAGAVKIPVDDDDYTVGDYNRTNIGANGVSYASNAYIIADMDNDKFINRYLDHVDVANLPYNKTAEELDKAGYALGLAQEASGITTILNAVQGKDKKGVAFGSTDPRNGKTGVAVSKTSDIYADLVSAGAKLDLAGVPRDGRRFALADPDALADILLSSKAIKAGDLSQQLVMDGIVAQMAGFNIILAPTLATSTANTSLGAKVVCGHPNYATRISGWSETLRAVDGNGDANVVGGAFIKGRKVYTQEVTKPQAFAYIA